MVEPYRSSPSSASHLDPDHWEGVEAAGSQPYLPQPPNQDLGVCASSACGQARGKLGRGHPHDTSHQWRNAVWNFPWPSKPACREAGGFAGPRLTWRCYSISAPGLNEVTHRVPPEVSPDAQMPSSRAQEGCETWIKTAVGDCHLKWEDLPGRTAGANPGSPRQAGRSGPQDRGVLPVCLLRGPAPGSAGCRESGCGVSTQWGQAAVPGAPRHIASSRGQRLRFPHTHTVTSFPGH